MHSSPDRCPAVRCAGVTAGYSRERPVLRNYTMQLTGPGLVQVTGPNGCGKSTLLELVSGYLHPWQGSVTIGDLPAGDPAARDRRRVCRTELALYPHMSLRDHLLFAARCVGIDSGAALARGERYGLIPWFDLPAASLSAGNAQRLWFLMCTLGDFSVACLDEPFNAVDAEGRAAMVDELTRWSVTRLILLVSHQLPTGLVIDRTLQLPAVKDTATPVPVQASVHQ